jgi:hypothetical protein
MLPTSKISKTIKAQTSIKKKQDAIIDEMQEYVDLSLREQPDLAPPTSDN